MDDNYLDAMNKDWAERRYREWVEGGPVPTSEELDRMAMALIPEQIDFHSSRRKT